jgi:hypothetical protein
VAISLARPRILTLSAAAVLLAQGAYGLFECWLESDWGPTLFCIAAIIAGLGVACRVWWSRPIVLALVLLLLIPSIRTGWHVTNSGLFRDRHAFEIFLMLLTGLAYVGLWAFCAYVAFRYVPARGRKQT